MKRSDITEECPEEFLDQLNAFIDDIEMRVDSALRELDDIKGVRDLHKIDTCLDELNELSGDLG